MASKVEVICQERTTTCTCEVWGFLENSQDQNQQLEFGLAFAHISTYLSEFHRSGVVHRDRCCGGPGDS